MTSRVPDSITNQTLDTNLYEFRTHEAVIPYETELNIPTKFQHVDIEKIFARTDQG